MHLLYYIDYKVYGVKIKQLSTNINNSHTVEVQTMVYPQKLMPAGTQVNKELTVPRKQTG